MKNEFSSSIGESLNGRNEVRESQSFYDSAKAKQKNSIKKDNTSLTEPQKHPGGRPTNASKALPKRQRYSLTLPSELYDEVLISAHKESMSFSTYVERALKAYKSNH